MPVFERMPDRVEAAQWEGHDRSASTIRALGATFTVRADGTAVLGSGANQVTVPLYAWVAKSVTGTFSVIPAAEFSALWREMTEPMQAPRSS